MAFIVYASFMEPIKSAQFIKGIVGTDPILQEEIPQIAFVGRSNVGKSSMINSLVGMRNLVKSSSTPGRTKEINFFLIEEKVYFVDLPGYGYAKLSASHAEKMRKMIMWYLEKSEANLKKVVLIVDAQAGPKQFDLEMADLLVESGHDFVVVANKADKLNQKEAAKATKILEEKFSNHKIFFYSAKTGKGKEKILEEIFG
ncbi:MAG: putative GTP-binding protein EngB [Candidatus Moranbacteria bacterium GW2011_GWC2_45_10]|nr:MAG: putative GTP-binding protein EngB [Candidatus Moranbacteria bacterium GW2011_GWC2_45_10]